jgi:NAD(P)-dependent dehydrogenase (short-subunit alcohol dehydrogenase family)
MGRSVTSVKKWRKPRSRSSVARDVDTPQARAFRPPSVRTCPNSNTVIEDQALNVKYKSNSKNATAKHQRSFTTPKPAYRNKPVYNARVLVHQHQSTTTTTMNIPQVTQTVRRAVYPSIDPANPKISAAGKTIIISGGAGGIGYAIAQGFCIAGAARVVILARRQEALDEAAAKLASENAATGRKTEIWTYLLDMKDTVGSETVFASIRARLNEGAQADQEKIDADVLITSAAHFTQGTLSLEFDPAAYRDSFETNTMGNLNLVRAFLAPEIPSIPFTSFDGTTKEVCADPLPKHKKIILDVSTISSYLLLPGQAPYAASKLAFTRILQALQAEFDRIDGQPLRVHSFNPGAIWTPGAAKVVPESIRELFTFDEESLPQGFAVWLASPEAEFLKGRFVLTNWDVDELTALKDDYASDPMFGTITLKQ